MKCAFCNEEATLQCPRCGRFVGNVHSTINLNYSPVRLICTDCDAQVNQTAAELAQKRRQLEEQARQESIKKEAERKQYYEKFQQSERERAEKEEHYYNDLLICPVCKGKGKVRPVKSIFFSICYCCYGKGKVSQASIDSYHHDGIGQGSGYNDNNTDD